MAGQQFVQFAASMFFGSQEQDDRNLLWTIGHRNAEKLDNLICASSKNMITVQLTYVSKYQSCLSPCCFTLSRVFWQVPHCFEVRKFYDELRKVQIKSAICPQIFMPSPQLRSSVRSYKDYAWCVCVSSSCFFCGWFVATRNSPQWLICCHSQLATVFLFDSRSICCNAQLAAVVDFLLLATCHRNFLFLQVICWLAVQ